MSKKTFLSSSNGQRADIKLSGISAPKQGTCLLDISIVTINSTKSKIKKNKSSNFNVISEIDEAIQDDLNIRYQQKINKYKNSQSYPVIPWCMTNGGTLHPEAEPFLKLIKKQIVPELSIILAKARHRNSIAPISNLNHLFITHHNSNSD